MAAEIAEGWEPIFFVPEKAGDVWGRSLAEGRAKRDPELGELDVIAQAFLAIGDDVGPLLELGRPMLALYIGGMGRRARTSTTTWPAGTATRPRPRSSRISTSPGRRRRPRQRSPRNCSSKLALIGPEGYVRERIAAFAEAGVTTLNVNPMAPDHLSRVSLIERARGIIADI